VSYYQITHTHTHSMLADSELAPQFTLSLTVFQLRSESNICFFSRSYRHLLRHVHGLGRLLLRVHEGKLAVLLEELGVSVDCNHFNFNIFSACRS
jgi:hypothetical protein